MKLRVLCFGKMDRNGYHDLQNLYGAKLARFFDGIDIVELKESTTPDPTKNMKINEAQLAKYIAPAPDVINILLDINGQEMTSDAWSQFIVQFNTNKNVTLQFLIGPSDGFSMSFRDQFKYKVSFGKATLPHQLARVVLLEQLYRAHKIAAHEKYHK